MNRPGRETDLPPGTFLLIRGRKRVCCTSPTASANCFAEDDSSELSGRPVVVLDPVPTSDPNEPLVGVSNDIYTV